MKSWRNVAVFGIVLILYVAINIYIGAHGLLWMRQWMPAMSVVVYWSVFALVALAYLLALLPWRKELYQIKRWLKIIGAYYMAMMQFAVIMLLIADLLYVVLLYFGGDMSAYIQVTGSIILFFIAVALGWGSRNAWSTVIRKYPVTIEKEVDDLKGLRVIVVSDIHLGDIVGKRHLQRMIDQIYQKKPDLVLMVGDILDDRIEPFIRHRMDQQLKDLQATYGVYAVLGNHEYYGGAVKQFTDMMDRVGIRVLQDEVIEVAGCYLVGRKDKAAESMDENGRQTIDALLAGINQSKPIIVMDHQPFHLDKASSAGVDLLLCGHTHRGQFAPNHWVTERMYEIDWGHMRKEQTDVVVTSGFGTWGPPIRLGSRSEIVELEIRFLRK